MKPLSKRQQELLDKLRDGWVLNYVTAIRGPGGTFYLAKSDGNGLPHVNAGTARALIDRGLVRMIRDDWKGATYRLR